MPTEARTRQPAAEAVPAGGQEEQSTSAAHAAQASVSQVRCVAADSTGDCSCLPQAELYSTHTSLRVQTKQTLSDIIGDTVLSC